jgi:peroxiredoxin Q/BCP
MLKEGDRAPSFQVTADDGEKVSSADYRGKNLVLFFYPKANTPGWTNEASEFRDAKKQFDKLGVVVLGASADPEKALASFKSKQKLNFTLLSDPEHRMLEAYGAWRMKKFMGRSFMGVARSSVLIGADGKIEEVWGNAKAKGHAAEVLARASQ